MSTAKLQHRVVFCSSEEKGYSARELDSTNKDAKGWLSARFPEYPQEIGFELLTSQSNVHISQIQILSHQSKIATKIEIFIGLGDDYESSQFKRLGYLSLDSNERSGYQARELKTVFVDQYANYIKFKILKNYTNTENSFDQVGIVAVTFFGEDILSTSMSASLPSTSSTTTSRNLSHHYNHPSSTSSTNTTSTVISNTATLYGIDVHLDPTTLSKLKMIAEAKNQAVQKEDYITAKSIKAVEIEIKEILTALSKVDLNKKDAVDAEDYDLAAEFKEKGDELRNGIKDKLQSLQVAGVNLQPPVPQHQPLAVRQSTNMKSSLAQYASMNTGMSRGDGGVGVGGRSPSNTYPSPDLSYPSMNSSRLNPPEEGNDGDYEQSYNGDVDDTYMDPNNTSSSSNNNNHHLYEGSPRGATTNNSGGNNGMNFRPTYDDERMPANMNDQYNVDEYNDNDNNKSPTQSSPRPPPAVNRFPPGEHPLDGVPNVDVDTLPEPDAFTAKTKQVVGQANVIGFLGEYLARCLISKSWILRDAVINKCKINLMSQLDDGNNNDDNDSSDTDPVTLISSSLPSIVHILKLGIEDKNLQVNFSAYAYCEYLGTLFEKYRLSKSTIVSSIDPLLVVLIEKLCDGNQRVRDGSKKILMYYASLTTAIGAQPLCSCLLRSLTAKQKTAPRPLQTRLQLLYDIYIKYASSLSSDSLLNYMKIHNAFAHSSGDVRDAAKELTIAIQKQIGSNPILPYLNDLRPKQKEEYMAIFGATDQYLGREMDTEQNYDPSTPVKKNNKMTSGKASPRVGGRSPSPPTGSRGTTGGGGGSGGGGGGGPSSSSGQRSGKPPSSSQQNRSNAPNKGNSKPNNTNNANNRYQEDNYEDEDDFETDISDKNMANTKNSNYDYKLDDSKMVDTSTTNKHMNALIRPPSSSAGGGGGVGGDTPYDYTCQFCGAGDTSWNEDQLDTHYLQACPYLAPCPACTQILEIASLPDHLLDECKYKSQYTPCDVTGLAIKLVDMDKWMNDPRCISPPDNCFYCPLCYAPVIDDNEPWRVHLIHECTANDRSSINKKSTTSSRPGSSRR